VWDKSTFDRAFPHGRKNRRSYESKLQEQVVNYLLLQYPKVRFISSLTGEYNSNAFTNARNSRIQFGPGQPDILIMYRNSKYVGLALELKTIGSNPFKKNGELKASTHLQSQNEWLMYMISQGWDAYFAVGFDHTKELIDKYLN